MIRSHDSHGSDFCINCSNVLLRNIVGGFPFDNILNFWLSVELLHRCLLIQVQKLFQSDQVIKQNHLISHFLRVWLILNDVPVQCSDLRLQGLIEECWRLLIRWVCRRQRLCVLLLVLIANLVQLIELRKRSELNCYFTLNQSKILYFVQFSKNYLWHLVLQPLTSINHLILLNSLDQFE